MGELSAYDKILYENPKKRKTCGSKPEEKFTAC